MQFDGNRWWLISISDGSLRRRLIPLFSNSRPSSCSLPLLSFPFVFSPPSPPEAYSLVLPPRTGPSSRSVISMALVWPSPPCSTSNFDDFMLAQTANPPLPALVPEWWTNKYLPSLAGVMNPEPFWSLNHLIWPFALSFGLCSPPSFSSHFLGEVNQPWELKKVTLVSGK